MYNKKLINNVILENDKIILKYESGIKKVIKDKYIVAYLQYNNFNKAYYIECINDALYLRNNYFKNKNKLTFNKFIKILENNNNSYYKFDTYHNGFLYFLNKPLSNELKQKLCKAFNNIELFISQCQYAPEIKTSCIFIKE